MRQNEAYFRQISRSIGARTKAWRECKRVYLSIREKLLRQGILDSSSVYTDLDDRVLVLRYTLKMPYKQVLKIWSDVSQAAHKAVSTRTSYKFHVSMRSAE